MPEINESQDLEEIRSDVETQKERIMNLEKSKIENDNRVNDLETRVKGMEGITNEMATLLKQTNERLHEVATAITGNRDLGIKGIVSAVEEVGRKHDRLTAIVMKAGWGIGGGGFVVIIVWEALKFYKEYLNH